jgi:glycosyltransferase involved in cell wall biosynthesis
MQSLPISVVIPAYRRPDEVRRAVASVLSQSMRPAEVIVVDDASGDGTADAARAAGARVVTLEENVGEGGARNAGIEAATQSWIALLDSDDEWLPRHLERLWPLRADHVIVAEACVAVGDGPTAGRLYGWCGPRPRVLRGPRDVAWPENTLTPSSTLVRRDAIIRAGGFALATPQAGDFDTWLRVLEHGTGLTSPRVGAIYHLHGTQASGDRRAMHAARIALYGRYRDRPWFDPRLLPRMVAVDAWDLRDRAMLLRALLRPQGVLGLAHMCAYRRRKRRAARSYAARPDPVPAAGVA